MTRVWHHLHYDPETLWEKEDAENERQVLEDEAWDEREIELPDFEREAA